METLKDLKDEELVAQLRAGVRPAFTEIYNRYWQPLYLYAYKRLKDEDEAADIVQDIFAALWHQGSLNELASLKSYLYAATRNRTINAIARSGRKETYLDQLERTYQEGVAVTDQTVALRELVTLLEAAVNALPPRMRAVYTKSKEEGCSHKQIADDLGISPETSKTTLNRALTILRAKLIPVVAFLALLLR